MPRKKRNIMKEFKINEISGVDMPAQQGATAVIMKRHTPEDDNVEKRSALTTEERDHTHLIMLNGGDGSDLNSGQTDWADDHYHPWIRTENGPIVIGIAKDKDGNPHDHIVGVMSKCGEDGYEDLLKRTFTSEQREKLAESGAAMSDGSFPTVNKQDLRNAISAFGRAKNKAAVAKHIKKRAKALKATDILPEEGTLADMMKSQTENPSAGKVGKVGTTEESTMPDENSKQVEELTKKLERATAVGTLTDMQKAHFEGLKEDEQDEFLAKSADEREEIVKKLAKAAQDDNPVVYTTAEGIELRKSAGDVMIAMAKQNDVNAKRNDKLQKKLDQTALEKRAETELANVPGTIEERAGMLKAVDAIEDESVRKAAMKILKSKNDSMAHAFNTEGHGGIPKSGSGEDDLDQLAKKHQEANSGMSYEKAYDAVLKTPEGAAAYNKCVN